MLLARQAASCVPPLTSSQVRSFQPRPTLPTRTASTSAFLHLESPSSSNSTFLVGIREQTRVGIMHAGEVARSSVGRVQNGRVSVADRRETRVYRPCKRVACQRACRQARLTALGEARLRIPSRAVTCHVLAQRAGAARVRCSARGRQWRLGAGEDLLVIDEGLLDEREPAVDDRVGRRLAIYKRPVVHLDPLLLQALPEGQKEHTPRVSARQDSCAAPAPARQGKAPAPTSSSTCLPLRIPGHAAVL